MSKSRSLRSISSSTSSVSRVPEKLESKILEPGSLHEGLIAETGGLILDSEGRLVSMPAVERYEWDIDPRHDFLMANPSQPRGYFDEIKIRALARSMKAQGQLFPIIATPVRLDVDEFRLLIVDGERRQQAAIEANIKYVRVLIRYFSDEQSVLDASGDANEERADFNAIERAYLYKMMVERLNDHTGRGGATKLAKAKGVAINSITNYLKLLILPEEIQAYMRSDRMGYSAARKIVNFIKKHPGTWKDHIPYIVEHLDGVLEQNRFEDELEGGIPDFDDYDEFLAFMKERQSFQVSDVEDAIQHAIINVNPGAIELVNRQMASTAISKLRQGLGRVVSVAPEFSVAGDEAIIAEITRLMGVNKGNVGTILPQLETAGRFLDKVTRLARIAAERREE